MKMPLLKSLKLYNRKGLEDLLERAVNRRLTLITGAPGRGKSTLILSFLQGLNCSYFWYNTGKKDSNIRSFSSKLLDYLHPVADKDNSDKSCDLSERQLIEVIQAALTVYCSQEFYIVLDNFAENENHTDFALFIQELINSSPATVHYILISQNNMLFKEFNNDLIVSRISDDQLVFPMEDIAEFFKEGYVIYLNKTQTAIIHSLTEGWAEAMNAIAENMLVNAGFLDNLQKNSVEEIIKIPQMKDYFNRIFAELRSEQKVLLLATGIVKELEEDLVALLADPEAVPQLEAMVANNLLIKPSPNQNRSYRYHKLWQAFLYKRARETLGTKRLSELHQLAGMYYFNKVRWKEAFYHFIQAGDFAQICNTMKVAGPEILDYNLTERLFSQVKSFSLEMISENPWAQYGYAYSLRFKDPERCYYYLTCALKGFRDQGDEKGILQSLLILIENSMFYSGGLDKMGEAIKDIANYSLPPGSYLEKIEAYKQVYTGWTHCYFTGNMHQAILLGEQVRRTSILLQDKNLQVWSAWILIVASTFAGNFDTATGYILEVLEAIEGEEMDPQLVMMALYLPGFNYTFQGNYEAARLWLEKAEHQAQKIKNNSFSFYIKHYLLITMYHLGNYEFSELILKQMKDSVRTFLKEDNYHILAYLHCSQAYHAFLMGKKYQSISLALQALEYRKKAGGEVYYLRNYLMLGGAYREVGDYQESENSLAEALKISLALKSSYFEASSYIQLALLSAQRDAPEQVHRYLEKALRIAVDKSFYSFYLWRDDDMSRLISTVQVSIPFRGYLEELIEKRKLKIERVETSNPRPNKMPVPASEKKGSLLSPDNKDIKVYLLGQFRLEVAKSEIKKISSQKALYLLKMLCANDKPLTVQKIITELWLDWDEKLAMNNFYNALHQLRKIYPEKNILSYRDGVCTLESSSYWTDLQEFNSLLTHANKHKRSKQESKELALLKQAVNLYRGELLEGENLGDFLLFERENVEKQYYGALLDIGRIMLNTAEYEDAVQVLTKVINSPYSEEAAYRMIIAAHYVQGNMIKVHNVYKKLKDYLHEELGVNPHEITMQLNERISSKENPRETIKWLLSV